MEKTTHSAEYKKLLTLLVSKRQQLAVTQVEMAKKLKMTQSAYSKMERGELRIDLIQLRQILGVLKVSLTQFVSEFEASLKR